MIKAPSVIKRYLARNYNMHNIPIGSKDVMNNIQHLPKNIGVFFAGNLANLKPFVLKFKCSLNIIVYN